MYKIIIQKKKPKCINTKNKPNLHPLCRHQQLCRLKMLFHLIGRSYCAPSSEIKKFINYFGLAFYLIFIFYFFELKVHKSAFRTYIKVL